MAAPSTFSSCPAPLVALLLPLLLLFSAPLALSCTLPPDGCGLCQCAALASLPGSITPTNWDRKTPLGTYYGLWNARLYPNQTASKSMPGGPWLGYDVYPTVESAHFINTTGDSTLSGCCLACAVTPACAVYQFFEKAQYSQIRTQLRNAFATTPPSGAYANGKQCYLLSGGSVKGTWPAPGPDNYGPYGSPFSPTHKEQILPPYSTYPPSFVGGNCNAVGQCKALAV